MDKIRLYLIYVFLFLVYTQGLWERVMGYSRMPQNILELALLLLFLISMPILVKRTPLSQLFIVSVLFSCFASVINGSYFIACFKYSRFFLYFILIYIVFWNGFLTVKQWLNLLKFIIFLVLIQGAGAVFNVFVLGTRVEGFVGLMSSIGGTTATIFPLFIISIICIVFMFRKWKNPFYDFILLAFLGGCSLVGYSSGKRAIYFLLPSFIMFATFVSLYKLNWKVEVVKRTRILVVFGILAFPVFIYGIKNSHGLNYSLNGRENSIEVIQKAIAYAEEYESAESQYGESTGRSNTTANIINTSLSSVETFFFGFGFGAVKDEATQVRLNIMYGIVGFTRDIVSGGWLYMILTILIFTVSMFKNESLNLKLTSTIRWVLASLFVATHFTYSSDYTVHIKIGSILAILLAFINSPNHKNVLEAMVKRNFIE